MHYVLKIYLYITALYNSGFSLIQTVPSLDWPRLMKFYCIGPTVLITCNFIMHFEGGMNSYVAYVSRRVLYLLITVKSSSTFPLSCGHP
jgi:hypothetical protein